MLPIFFPQEHSETNRSFGFRVSKEGQTLPVFFPGFSWDKSIFRIWVSKEGEMLPIFFPGIFSGQIDW